MVALVGRSTISRVGVGQKALVILLQALRNQALGNAALAPSGNNIAVGAVHFMVDGRTFTYAGGTLTLSGQSLPVTSAGMYATWRIEINGAGTLSVRSSGISGAPGGPAPVRQAGFCTLGFVLQPPGNNPGANALAAGAIFSGDPDLLLPALSGSG